MTDAFRSALREQGGLLAELAERPAHDRQDDADPPAPPA